MNSECAYILCVDRVLEDFAAVLIQELFHDPCHPLREHIGVAQQEIIGYTRKRWRERELLATFFDLVVKSVAQVDTVAQDFLDGHFIRLEVIDVVEVLVPFATQSTVVDLHAVLLLVPFGDEKLQFGEREPPQVQVRPTDEFAQIFGQPAALVDASPNDLIQLRVFRVLKH